MKPLSEVMPGLLDIQIQIQAVCEEKPIFFLNITLLYDKNSYYEEVRWHKQPGFQQHEWILSCVYKKHQKAKDIGFLSIVLSYDCTNPYAF